MQSANQDKHAQEKAAVSKTVSVRKSNKPETKSKQDVDSRTGDRITEKTKTGTSQKTNTKPATVQRKSGPCRPKTGRIIGTAKPAERKEDPGKKNKSAQDVKIKTAAGAEHQNDKDALNKKYSMTGRYSETAEASEYLPKSVAFDAPENFAKVDEDYEDKYSDDEFSEDFDEFETGDDSFEAEQEETTDSEKSSELSVPIEEGGDIGQLLDAANDLLSEEFIYDGTETVKENDDQPVLLSNRSVYGNFVKSIEKECLRLLDDEMRHYDRKWKKLEKECGADAERLVRCWTEVMLNCKTGKRAKKKIKKSLKHASRKAWKKLCKSLDKKNE